MIGDTLLLGNEGEYIVCLAANTGFQIAKGCESLKCTARGGHALYPTDHHRFSGN
jgi:hypothetical protein